MRTKLLLRIMFLILFITGMSTIHSKVYSLNERLNSATNKTVVNGGVIIEHVSNMDLNVLFSPPAPGGFKIDVPKSVGDNNIMMSKACCPEFILSDAVNICPPQGACGQNTSASGTLSLAACKNKAHTYTVFPNNPTFTYTWTVSGGTPISFTGNPNIIVWGGGSTGTIKVVMSNFGVGGNCLDSIIMDICLIDGPKANFTVSNDTVCLNTPIHFTNTSIGGSVYLWDFGDGTTSSLANPPDHSYSLPGIYKVLLTATDMGSGQLVTSVAGDQQKLVPCGCSDTISEYIVVLSGAGPTITNDCCFGTVCAGDTSSFCTTMSCGTYNWSVTGGTIISGLGTNCIKIKWNTVYTVPTTVTLQSCSTSTCPGATTLNVPVLYPNLPISGPITLCVGASGTYSLPWLPGTYYKWTVTGGLYSFNLTDRNTTSVNITFNTSGTYWVKCVYDNPLAGCNGVDSVQVNILPVFSITGDKIVCEGNAISYYASGPALWTISPAGPTILSGNGTASILASFTPGTYTITATPLNPSAYCNANAILSVQAVAKPILSNINGVVNACPGTNLVYSITSNVSGSPFIWSISGGTGTINSQMGANNDSIVTDFSGTGPWIVSVYQNVEISPGVFCPSLTKSILVNPYLPPVITGTSTVCVDGIGTYSAGGSTPPGGYLWTISPSSQGTIQSGQGTNSVTILWHGPSNVATLSVSSCAGNNIFSVTVNGPPIALASYNTLPIFCLGGTQTLTLSTPVGVGYTYQWYNNIIGLIPSATSATLNINVSSFALAGIYQYYVIITKNGCSVKSNIINVEIDNCTQGTSGGGPFSDSCGALAFFKTYVVCNKITLLDLSTVVAPATIINYQWAISGPGTGVFTPNANSANPGLTVSASGTYTITLTITSSTGCIATWTVSVNVLLPVANFTVTSPVCVNSIASFTAIPNNPNDNYAWTFGDGATSYTAITDHAYSSTGNPTITLVITDDMGCTAAAKKTITVNPTPNCIITASDTIFCPGSSATLYGCAGMSSYQWYKNGTLITGANSINYNVNTIGEYWVSVTNSFGCTSTSNHIYMYMYNQPIAKITGGLYVCALSSSTSSFNLSSVYNSKYSYSWSSNPVGATFSPTNTNSTTVSVTLPVVLPVTYQFIVNVTDTTTGCTASDTLCVTFFETPSLTVPFLNACEGTSVTLTPTPVNPVIYSYQWSNGATTPVIIASSPGFYSLTITDKATGCTATANAGSINAKPDLSLFPLGCKSICNSDTLYLYIPLPLNALYPNNTYADAYPVITWYDNGNYALPIGSGQNLVFPGISSGNHQISVVVTNSSGCTDTAGVFCVKHSCCQLILDSISTNDASCPESTDGSFTVLLDTASIGGPFTITSTPVIPPLPTTITPGVPFTVSNLVAGTYVITISDPSGLCIDTYDVVIGSKETTCCFAEIDTLFHKITSNITYNSDVVWDGKYYIADNVIVTVSGATLDITTMDVVFGQCAGIDFINGAHLRANNSVFRPCNINGTWRGLRFVGDGQFSNIINENTFKSAEVALYFQAQSDGVVSGNLFSNCNYGIRVDDNDTFNYPISGNQFVTDEFFPTFVSCYSFVNNSSTYGIYAWSSRLLQQVSQNGFVNSKAANLPATYGIYQYKSGGLFSANTFTDQTYSIFLNTAQFPSNIINNNIEVNTAAVSPLSTIYIDNTNSPVIEINNNQISNNFSSYDSYSAIYAQYSSNVSINNNNINGFKYGIIASTAYNFQISNNQILNPDVSGIYFYGTSTVENFITCNTINMRNYNSTSGIYSIDLSTLSEISSNCIFNCNTSMDLRSFTVNLLPKVRNNYLYNYNYIGINDFGYSGNIGTLTPADPGLNTLWSNDNSAVDINSNTNITVADNFGMFNISFPQVQIVSNRPYNSTASCGQQIYNMPSQGNLNINYTCDNYSKLLGPLAGSVGSFNLASNYSTLLQPASTQFDYAGMVLACIDNSDISLLNQLLALSSLTNNEKSILQYNYYYKKADFVNARVYMNNFSPQNSVDDDYKFLRLVDLDIIQNGFAYTHDETIQRLNTIVAEKNINSNFAVSILNNSTNYRDYIFEKPQISEPNASGSVLHVGNNESYLNIYPNPATEKVLIELVNSNITNGTIKLFDVNGKQITDYKLNFVAGGIELDIHNLSKGLYFVTLTDQDFKIILTGKLIKE